MDFQMRPIDLPTPDLGMDFGWQSDVYHKFTGNSQYALDASNKSVHVPNDLDMKPK